jgi:hypothetical protein
MIEQGGEKIPGNGAESGYVTSRTLVLGPYQYDFGEVLPAGTGFYSDGELTKPNSLLGVKCIAASLPDFGRCRLDTALYALIQDSLQECLVASAWWIDISEMLLRDIWYEGSMVDESHLSTPRDPSTMLEMLTARKLRHMASNKVLEVPQIYLQYTMNDGSPAGCVYWGDNDIEFARQDLEVFISGCEARYGEDSPVDIFRHILFMDFPAECEYNHFVQADFLILDGQFLGDSTLSTSDTAEYLCDLLDRVMRSISPDAIPSTTANATTSRQVQILDPIAASSLSSHFCLFTE